jgi:hypothetical protein
MLEGKVITLRNVYGKMKEVHLQPCRDRNGARYPWVKPVRYDAMGNSEMILSQDELNSPERDYYVPEDLDIVITDGTQFDLKDPYQRNIWKSIENSDQIAPTRDARDKNGDLFIDGNKNRYGMAEFYVDIPGEESQKSVSKKQKITKAWSYIGQDSKSGRLTKCKILGKYMENAPDSDVEDYLYQRAEKNPDEVLELYQSGDMALKLLLIDAKQRGVILKKDGMYVFADTLLGATDDAVMIFFKTPSNKRVLDQIKFEVYPEYAPINKLEETIEVATPEVITTPSTKKTSTKK